MTPDEYKAQGDKSYNTSMRLMEIANKLIRTAKQHELDAITAWAKAEQIETRPPTPEPSPPLDTARPPC